MELIREIRAIYDNYDALDHRDPRRLDPHADPRQQAALAGADVATIPPAVLRNLAKHPLTDKGLDALPRRLEEDRPVDPLRRGRHSPASSRPPPICRPAILHPLPHKDIARGNGPKAYVFAL